MSNNPASTRYFHELRTRLDKQRAEDREDDSVNVYEQLRRLIDAMEASKFLDGPET